MQLNPTVDPSGNITRFSSPRAFFILFVTKDVLDHIVFQTELYNTWRSVNAGSRKMKRASPEEIRQVLGTMLFMGIVKLPSTRMYWQSATNLQCIYLKRRGIWAVSTLNQKRSRNCPIPSKKECNKLDRGTIIEMVDQKEQIVITTWIDNKPVLMLSNYIGKEPTNKCTRFDRKQRKHVEIDCLVAVDV